MSNQTSPIGRVAFPRLVKAQPRSEGKEPRYSTTLVFDENVNLTELRKLVDDLVSVEYKGKKPPAKFRYPFKSGEDMVNKEGERLDGFADTDTCCEFWRYESKGPIGIVDAQRNKILPGDVYAGMFGRVVYRAYLYDVEGNCGANFELLALQKSHDGEPVGYAPVDAETAFDELEAPESLADVLE